MNWQNTIINKYEDELEDLYKFNPPQGWRTLVESLLEYIHWHNKVHGTAIKIFSIEKRHGGLHFAVHHHPIGTNSSISEEIFGAIHLAETLSCKLCEVCGRPGEFVKSIVNESIVIGTYCDEHLPETTN
tara:strand:- start:207 stop:593 length:387 start_codon:yes stop_codon:yes gene_type:complete